MFFVQTSTLPQECTENLPKTWKALYAKQPTPDQNSLWDKRIALMTIPEKKFKIWAIHKGEAKLVKYETEAEGMKSLKEMRDIEPICRNFVLHVI